ncbi:MAG: sigma-70 family RNA polymerase sigma factor [Nannocystaceae bacterium]|nr:sigma-70 family RNA polymerase sigma factor [Nannocystaceae bacterium]
MVRAVSADSGAGPSFDARDYPGLRRALSRAVRRACPSWMSESAEDIVQIAMTKVVAAMEAGKSAEEIGLAYVARVAYHAVVDEMRRQRRRRTLTTVDVDEVHGTVAEPRPDPEVATAGARLGTEIRDCLTQMARSRRLAVVLYLEGRGATEIANMFDWKRKQADNLVYRGIGDLRRCLADKGLEP